MFVFLQGGVVEIIPRLLMLPLNREAYNEFRGTRIGLLDKSPIHPREVFADVIADRAAAVIFAHNHPSGDLQSSEADLKIHEQLTQSAKILGIRILDHVILSRKGHYSFQEKGLI